MQWSLHARSATNEWLDKETHAAFFASTVRIEDHGSNVLSKLFDDVICTALRREHT